MSGITSYYRDFLNRTNNQTQAYLEKLAEFKTKLKDIMVEIENDTLMPIAFKPYAKKMLPADISSKSISLYAIKGMKEYLLYMSKVYHDKSLDEVITLLQNLKEPTLDQKEKYKSFAACLDKIQTEITNYKGALPPNSSSENSNFLIISKQKIFESEEKLQQIDTELSAFCEQISNIALAKIRLSLLQKVKAIKSEFTTEEKRGMWKDCYPT